jgi:serine protein kinase
MQMPVHRIFISEAGRSGVGTYAPHDPTTCGYRGSRRLGRPVEGFRIRRRRRSARVVVVGRGVRGEPRVARDDRDPEGQARVPVPAAHADAGKERQGVALPLIYVDETIVAHTNLAEFRKFLQESENEALLDRMVIIQVPYTLSYKDEARIYKKLTSSTQAFREVHLDPHALHLAAVFAILTRMQEGDDKEDESSKRVRLYAARKVEGVPRGEIEKMRARNPEEGLSGVSPRFVINALSNAIIQSARAQPDQHGGAARAQGLDRIRRAHGREEEAQVGRFPRGRAQGLLQPLGQGGRAQGAVRVVRAGGRRNC